MRKYASTGIRDVYPLFCWKMWVCADSRSKRRSNRALILKVSVIGNARVYVIKMSKSEQRTEDEIFRLKRRTDKYSKYGTGKKMKNQKHFFYIYTGNLL